MVHSNIFFFFQTTNLATAAITVAATASAFPRANAATATSTAGTSPTKPAASAWRACYRLAAIVVLNIWPHYNRKSVTYQKKSVS